MVILPCVTVVMYPETKPYVVLLLLHSNQFTCIEYILVFHFSEPELSDGSQGLTSNNDSEPTQSDGLNE